jgi:predicted RNA methylase
MAFDVDGALAEGYSAQEIADHLGKLNGFNVKGARKEGYTDDEIISHMTKPRKPTQFDTTTWDQGIGATDTTGTIKAPGSVMDGQRPEDLGRGSSTKAQRQIAADTLGVPAERGSIYGKRVDGTDKGDGWLGPLKRPDGGISTELSIGVNLGGKETEIPLLVPTLTQAEIQSLLNGERPSEAIVQKAVGHARDRIAEGKSPFKESGAAPQLTEDVGFGDLAGIARRTSDRNNVEALAKSTARRTGALPEVAQNIATGAYGAAGGDMRQAQDIAAGTGTVDKSNFDFDTANEYRNADQLARGTAKGVAGLKKSALGVHQFIADTVGADAYSQAMQKGIQELDDKTAAIGDRSGHLERNFENAIASIISNTPGLVGGVITGSEVLPLAVMGAQVFGEEYASGKPEQSYGEKVARASLFTAAEVIGEKFGMGDTIKALRSMKGLGQLSNKQVADEFSKHILKAAAKEVPGEELTTTLQFLTDKIPGIGQNPQAGLSEYMQQVADTFTTTVMQSAMMAGGGRGAIAAHKHLSGDPREQSQLVDAESAKDRALNAWATRGLTPTTNTPPASVAATPGAVVAPGAPSIEPAAPSIAEEAPSIPPVDPNAPIETTPTGVGGRMTFDDILRRSAERRAAQGEDTQEEEHATTPDLESNPVQDIQPSQDIQHGSAAHAQTASQESPTVGDNAGIPAPDAATPGADQPSIQHGSEPVTTPPVRAYSQDSATKMAKRLTSQGLPSEAYPHPTEPGKWAIRELGENNAPAAPPPQPEAAERLPKASPAQATQAPIMRRDDLVGAIMRVTGGKGVAAHMAQTIVGDTANNATKLRGLFTREGQADLDDLATLLRDEEGYDIKDGNDLAEKIRDASGGTMTYSMARQERDAAAGAEAQYKNDIRRRASDLGVKTVARKFSDIERDVLTLEEKKLEREISQLDDEERAVYDALIAEAESLDIDIADILETVPDSASVRQALELVADQVESRVNDKLREINTKADEAANEDKEGREYDVGIDEEAGGDAAGEAKQDRAPGVAAPGAQRPAGTGGDFGLEGQTDAEAAAEHARKQRPEEDLTKDQIDAEAAHFSLAGQSQADPRKAPTGGQSGLFTADGRPTVAAQSKLDGDAEKHLQQFPIGTRVKVNPYRLTSGESPYSGRTGTVVDGHFDGWRVELDKNPREHDKKTVLILSNIGLEKLEEKDKQDSPLVAEAKKAKAKPAEQFVTPPKLDLPTVEHDGDTWYVLSTGDERENGDLMMHLSSATRGRKQNNGVMPVQMSTWLPRTAKSDYNDWVRGQYRDATVRRLQSDTVVRQENGKPFKSIVSAEAYQSKYDLTDTHAVHKTDGGYELHRLGPAQRPSALKALAERQAADPEMQRQEAAFARAKEIGEQAQSAVDAYENGDIEIDEFERRLDAAAPKKSDDLGAMFDDILADELAKDEPAKTYPEPNSHGVYTKDTPGMNRVAYGSNNAHVYVYTIEIAPNTWASGRDHLHRLGNSAGGGGLPSKNGRHFASEAEARDFELNRTILENQAIAEDKSGSAVSKAQQAEARKIIAWAESKLSTTPSIKADIEKAKKARAPKSGIKKDLAKAKQKKQAKADDSILKPLGSAARNTAAGLSESIDALGALFGSTPGRLNSGLVFDEQTYAKAKPHFQAAISHLQQAGQDIQEVMRAIVRMVLDKFGKETAQNMRPYVVRFVEEYRDGTLDQKESTPARPTKEEFAAGQARVLAAPFIRIDHMAETVAFIPRGKNGDIGVLLQRVQDGKKDRWNGTGHIHNIYERDGKLYSESAYDADESVSTYSTDPTIGAAKELIADLENRRAELEPIIDGLSDEAIRSLYDKLDLAGSNQPADQLREMLKQEHPNDIEAGLQALEQEELDDENASSYDDDKEINDAPGSQDSQPDREDADDGLGVGQGSIFDEPGAAGRDGSRTVQGSTGSGRTATGGNGVPNDGAASDGKRGDQSVYRENGEIGSAPNPAGDHDDRGSDRTGDGRVSTDDDAADEAGADAPQAIDIDAKRAEQSRAQGVTVKPGDRANIDESLPFLLPEQRDDVAFAERRFSKEDGIGAMFTNGTGTGKTYSGLGIAKRFERQGKTNILIVAPSDKIVEDWVSSGENLQLKITQLPNTSSAGTGIVATTFANFGDNSEIASRDWDLVITDEAHYLENNKQGEATLPLEKLRAITFHPRARHYYARHVYPKQWEALVNAQHAASLVNNDTMAEEIVARKEALRKAEAAWREVEAKALAKFDAVTDKDKPRVAMLSATPFAYVKNVDYAEGFLFKYGPEPEMRGYNVPNAYQRFYVEHFGYRMRYNKLTTPPAEVDSQLMEINFNSWLKKNGALSARRLDVAADYDRRFVTVPDLLGSKIDDGLKFLREAEDGLYRPLLDHVNDVFDYHGRMYLLESIKARHAVPIIKEHLALGRKVVVFHDWIKGGAIHPFKFPDLGETTVDVSRPDGNGGQRTETVKWNDLVAQFNAARPDLVELPLDKLKSSLETLTEAFPEALKFNGRESKKARRDAIKKFNDDNGSTRIVIAQSAAAEGWSAHDTTGKFQRVLINIGMPGRPVANIQIEGRIYRTGQVTDAAFRYLTTGADYERFVFADRIAERSSTAENLALGEDARDLRQAFIDAYLDAEENTPGAEDGKGGKEKDRATRTALSPWDKAKAYYFAQQKRDSRTKAQEGTDYFATPEPVGLKMVEFAEQRDGESAMEPSGGHGAIARWFNPRGHITVVEPSMQLAGKLKMAIDDRARLVRDTFENLDTSANKFDTIVMNPPFGVGGKTAIEHLDKALKHLRDGGRIVALIPEGPAADKRFDEWLYGKHAEAIKPVFKNDKMELRPGDTVTFQKRGLTGSLLTFKGTVTDFRDDMVYVKTEDATYATGVNPAYLKSVESTGPKSRQVSNAPHAYMRASYGLPNVTFNRAGTSVKTRIVIIDRVLDNEKAANLQIRGRVDFDADNINDLFDLMEHAGAPQRVPQEAPANVVEEAIAEAKKPSKAAKPVAKPGEDVAAMVKAKDGTHSKTGATLYGAELAKRVEREDYDKVNSVVKQYGGYWSKFAKMFVFKTQETRDAFMEEMNGNKESAKYSLDTDEISVEDYKTPALAKAFLTIADRDDAFGAKSTQSPEIEQIIDDLKKEGGYEIVIRDKTRSVTTIGRVIDLGVAKYITRDMDIIDTAKPQPYVIILPDATGIESWRLYQMAMAWAHNNGKQLKPDPNGLTAINYLRRSEAMISSMLRFKTSRHVIPHHFQFEALLPPEIQKLNSTDEDKIRAAQALRDQLWQDESKESQPELQRAIFESNLNNILMAAARTAFKRAPWIANYRVGDDGVLYRWKSGRWMPVHPGAFHTLVGDAMAAKTGVGHRTLRRSALVLSILSKWKRPAGSDRLGGRGDVGSERVGRRENEQLREEPTGWDRAFDEALSNLSRSPVAQRILYDINGQGRGVAAEIKKSIAAISAKWKNAPAIVVLKSPAEAPFKCNAKARGAFHNGKVYLFTDNLKDADAAQFVALHEVVGHYGLAGILGDNLSPLMKQIYATNKRVRELADQIQAKYKKAGVEINLADATEEALANQAAGDNSINLFGRLVAAIREALRKAGFSIAINDNDVKALLQASRKYVEGGRAGQGGSATRYAIGKLTDSAAFRKWFGNSKVVDAEGNPLVVYHGTADDFAEFNADHSGRNYPSYGGNRGFFFTSSPGTASVYAEKPALAYLNPDDPENARFGKGTANIMPVYLRIEKPLSIKTKASPDKYFDHNRNKIYERADKAGADGIIITGGNRNLYVAFAPHQIKSSIGNNGDFDPSSSDIRYALIDDAKEKAGLAKPKAKFADRLRSIMASVPGADTLRQEVLDKFHGINVAEQRNMANLPIEQSAYVAARFSTGVSSIMHGLLLHGAPRWANDVRLEKIPGTKGLLEILEPVKDELDDWLGWMVGRRANRLMSEGKEKNFTQAEINELLSLAHGRDQKFKDVAQAFAEFKGKILDIGEGAGIIDATTRPMWDQLDWIPFYRTMEDDGTVGGPRNKRGFSGQSSGIRKLRGSEAAINDPLENILMNFSHIIDASLKNNVLRLAIEHAPDAVTKASYEMSPQLIPLSEVKRALELNGVDPLLIAAIPKAALQGIQKMWSIQPPTGKDVVRVMKGGKAEYYHVEDPLLLRALSSFATIQFPGLNALRFMKRLLTSMTTSTPEFIAANYARDVVAAMMTTRHGFHFADSLRGIKKSYLEQGGFEDMLFAGASFSGGHIDGTDPTESARNIRRTLRAAGFSKLSISDALSKAWEKYRDLGDAIENANREAIYESALQETGSTTRAAYEAKDIMDFSLRGSHPIVQLLADVVPFLNSRIQGLYRLGRSDKKRMLIGGAMMMTVSALLYLLNHDDDRYKEIPDYEKDTYWHIFFPGASGHVRIPKPFELGVIFGAIPERILSAAMGDISVKKALQRVAWNIVEQIKFNPIPQAVMPAAEVAMNYDTFRNRPIENAHDQRLMPSMRSNSSTSETMRTLAKMAPGAFDVTGMSPKKLEHLWNGYLGAMGAYTLGLADLVVYKLNGGPEKPEKRLDSYPLIKRFYQESPTKASQFKTDLYEMFREVGELERSINELHKQGEHAKAKEMTLANRDKLKQSGKLSMATDILRMYQKKIDRITEDPKMSPAEKRKQIDALTARGNAMAARTAPQVQKAGRF